MSIFLAIQTLVCESKSMKTTQEHYTTVNGTTTRHATHADALSAAFDAFNAGFEATVWTDTVQVFENTEEDRAKARASVRAHALEICAACAGK